MGHLMLLEHDGSVVYRASRIHESDT